VIGFGGGFTVLAAGLATLPAGLVDASLLVTSETFTAAGAGFCSVAGVTAADPVEAGLVPAAEDVPVGCGFGVVAEGTWAEVAEVPGAVFALAVEFPPP
jgi:hypothetical protein